MKIALLSNQSRSMANFWKILISRLKSLPADVICVVPGGDGESESVLRKAGAKIVNYFLDRKGLNPINDLRTRGELRAVFAGEKPDLVFATTIKPIIYGAPAAAAAGVPAFFATITGLGYAFERDSFPKKILNKAVSFLYRRSLAKSVAVFFQNRDDAGLFRDHGILKDVKHILFARGTGVDTGFFTPVPLPVISNPDNFTFLLVGRILVAKGVDDYADAATILKKKYPGSRFLLLGPKETGPGGVSDQRLADLEKKGIEYVGETRDTRSWLAKADAVVLPSWREGVPTALMEAMSMGRPCVATDVPGCREAVRDGVTGVLTPPRDARALAEAMEKLILNPALAEAAGRRGRDYALEKFDAVKVADKIIADMRALTPNLPWPEEKRD